MRILERRRWADTDHKDHFELFDAVLQSVYEDPGATEVGRH